MAAMVPRVEKSAMGREVLLEVCKNLQLLSFRPRSASSRRFDEFDFLGGLLIWG